jgi:transposase
MSRKAPRRYTEEFIQEAIALALKSPTIQQTALSLGIPPGTLHTWMKRFNKLPIKPLSENQPDIATLMEENRRLQKELAVIKEEKEILKKAAAYFAQHQK